MIVLHYEPNGKLTEARIEYSSWFTRKVMLLPGMLQCPVMSICQPQHFGLTAGLNHPVCLYGNIIQQTLSRNARFLKGPSHQFHSSRKLFQSTCLQTKFGMFASKKVSKDCGCLNGQVQCKFLQSKCLQFLLTEIQTITLPEHNYCKDVISHYFLTEKLNYCSHQVFGLSRHQVVILSFCISVTHFHF